MLLNEMELVYLLAALESHLSEKVPVIMFMGRQELLEFSRGYVFDKENLSKAPVSVLRMILGFFSVALAVKANASESLEEREMFFDVFPHLISAEAARQAERIFSVKRESSELNAIKLNEIYKRLNEKDESALPKDQVFESKVADPEPKLQPFADIDEYLNFYSPAPVSELQ